MNPPTDPTFQGGSVELVRQNDENDKKTLMYWFLLNKLLFTSF